MKGLRVKLVIFEISNRFSFCGPVDEQSLVILLSSFSVCVKIWFSSSKVDAQLQVVRKLEEKEHLLQSNIGTGEKELGLRTQALEMNKRKVWLITLSSEAMISLWGTNKCDTDEIIGSSYSLALG